MEYCPRGDLFYLIKERNLTEDQIRFFAAELVIALEYLHNNKIMHRWGFPLLLLIVEI